MQELYEYLHAPNEMPLFKQRQRYGESSVRPLDELLFHAGGPRGTNCVEMGLKFHVHTRTLEEEEEEQGWNPPGIPRVGMT